jgi:glycosyltransferase involved in cell wall biosynthesis
MISVVIPTYNQARYLSQAVESVWMQEVDDLEVLIVDDGSTDETSDVIRGLAAKGELRWIRQENSGPAAARNRGIKESRGELIAFLDADDYWIQGKLKDQIAAFGAESEASDFCFSGSFLVDDNCTILANRVSNQPRILLSELIWGNCITTSSVLVRKTLLLEVGLFNEMLTIGEDWDLWLRLTLRTTVNYIPKPLIAVRSAEWASKYQMKTYETATKRVLARFYETVKDDDKYQHLVEQRGKVLSWHLSVLAKSYLRHNNVIDFCRLGVQSALAHPLGLGYIFKLWGRPNG